MTNAAPSELADKRSAVFDAALALFAQRGFHGTSVPDIARRAKVGAGTIYRYFDSKEALVNELYQHHKVVLLKSLMRGYDPDVPPRMGFRRFWSNAIEFVRSDLQAFNFLELHHHAPYLDEKSRQLEVETMEMAHTFVRWGIEQQVFKPYSPALLFSIIWGCFRGLVQGGCDGRIDLSDSAIAQAEECVWEAIRR
jgi:AcrR family transcriptional regulator